jgi:uncharacterized membrane protein
MDRHLISHLILGPTILLISLALKLYPPKKINGFYGYRTPRSMKSKEAWQAGNRFGANTFFWTSILTCFVQTVTFSLLDVDLSFRISAGFLVAGVLVGIVLTELHLKRKGF